MRSCFSCVDVCVEVEVDTDADVDICVGEAAAQLEGPETPPAGGGR